MESGLSNRQVPDLLQNHWEIQLMELKNNCFIQSDHHIREPQLLKTIFVGFSGQLWFLAASMAARMLWRCCWRAALMSKRLMLWVTMPFIMLVSTRTQNLLQLSKLTWTKAPEVSPTTFKSAVCTCWLKVMECFKITVASAIIFKQIIV